MNTLCPACGVAVVPGYVKCPKCHARLSLGPARSKRPTADPGGTAIAQKRFPISTAILGVGAAAALILVFGVRNGGKKTEAAKGPPSESTEAVSADPQPRVATPAALPASSQATTASAAQDPGAVAADLEDTLRRQRLWGRAAIIGQRIDVRSGSCGDPAMRSVLDSKQSLLHGAGLTKLRCLEQSGAVVFEHDL